MGHSVRCGTHVVRDEDGKQLTVFVTGTLAPGLRTFEVSKVYTDQRYFIEGNGEEVTEEGPDAFRTQSGKLFTMVK
jgi:hypothetical protein